MKRPFYRSPLSWVGILALFALLVSGCQEKPEKLLQRARSSVNLASKAGASSFAESEYRKAQQLLQQGWLEMARQNAKLAPLRNYARAESLLVSAATFGDQAADNARARVRALKVDVRQRRSALADELAAWRKALNGTLTMFDAERHWSQADIALKTSLQLLEKGQYHEAIKAIDKGYAALSAVSVIVSNHADDESQKMRIWRRWVDETVQQSRQSGLPAIVVDKSAHRLYLLKSGKVAATFNCELGYNSSGQKLFSGDGATPEGKYLVTQKKNRGSKFYKALLISYPNENDKQRFSSNRSRGVISNRARIGGLIEIHGNGGRSSDWTDGCVALTNDDMDRLMSHASIGTPVTIVRRLEQWP